MIGTNVNQSLLCSCTKDIWSAGRLFLLIFLICLEGCSHPVCLDLVDDGPKNRFTITIQPGAEGRDAEVSSFYPEENFGNVKGLNALTWKENMLTYTQRGYIDFDIKKIPAKARIISAYLKLFADTISNSPNVKGHPLDGKPGLNIKGHFVDQRVELENEWQIYRIKEPWNENEITWFEYPKVSMTDILNLPGPRFSDESFTIDVTEHIRQKYKGNSEYNGFMIINKVENPYQCVVFCSSDNDQKELRPQLIVEYEK